MIHYFWPRNAKLITKLPVADSSPTTVAELMSGVEVRRTFNETPKRSYSALTRIRDEEAKYELQKLIRDCRGSLNTFTFTEPVSEFHSNVLSGVGDGVNYQFPVYARDVEEGTMTIFLDGSPVTDLPLYPGNILTDNQAAAVDGLFGVTALSADYIRRRKGIARAGLYCFEVGMAAEGVGFGIRTGAHGTYNTVHGFAYIAMASVLSETDTQAHAVLHSVGQHGGIIESITGPVTDIPAGVWTTVSATGTTSWDAHELSMSVLVDTVPVSRVFIDCLSIARGNKDDWWLPSQAPDLAILSGVEDGTVVTTSYIGRRVAMVRFANDNPTRSLNTIGENEFAVDLVEVINAS